MNEDTKKTKGSLNEWMNDPVADCSWPSAVLGVDGPQEAELTDSAVLTPSLCQIFPARHPPLALLTIFAISELACVLLPTVKEGNRTLQAQLVPSNG